MADLSQTGLTPLASTLLLVAALASGCGDEAGSSSYAPLSERCDRCLSTDADGCSLEWDACEAEPDCEEHVLCELRLSCYERAPGDCAESCEEPAGAAADAAEVFEACARSTCVEDCGFVAE